MTSQNRTEKIETEIRDLIRLCGYLIKEVNDSSDKITETTLANIHGINEHSGTIIELESRVELTFS